MIRSRIAYEGTRLDLTDASSSAWWLMSSSDEASIKTRARHARPARLAGRCPEDDGRRGAAPGQRGHWDTTTANAWGTVAVRRFATLYPAEAIAGTTSLHAGQPYRLQILAALGRPAPGELPASARAGPAPPVAIGRRGPWASVSVSAAVPLTKPLNAGYRMARKVDVVQARTKGVLTRGDVVKVTITVEATAERNWVVIDDPIPAGGTIIGDLGGQSKILADQGSNGGGFDFVAQDGEGKLWNVEVGAQLAYVERGNDSWRAFFSWLPKGKLTVSYLVRLNGAGRFNLPPSRVEAMYSPAIRAQLPNAPMTVAQR